ncbi:MAG: hypothetical protein K6C40_03165 [Thermoguttaceae bacterium]|nr:hypothetical protein [Thermoguttaceae bacterium]
MGLKFASGLLHTPANAGPGRFLRSGVSRALDDSFSVEKFPGPAVLPGSSFLMNQKSKTPGFFSLNFKIFSNFLCFVFTGIFLGETDEEGGFFKKN